MQLHLLFSTSPSMSPHLSCTTPNSSRLDSLSVLAGLAAAFHCACGLCTSWTSPHQELHCRRCSSPHSVCTTSSIGLTCHLSVLAGFIVVPRYPLSMPVHQVPPRRRTPLESEVWTSHLSFTFSAFVFPLCIQHLSNTSLSVSVGTVVLHRYPPLRPYQVLRCHHPTPSAQPPPRVGLSLQVVDLDGALVLTTSLIRFINARLFCSSVTLCMNTEYTFDTLFLETK
jgi:hypothetical protein